MGKTAIETDRDMRRAMTAFEAQVLDARNFDPATATYRYEGPVSEKIIMNIAGVKSRGTLRPAYHEKLRADLKALVLGLKIKTGKRPASKYSSDDDINKQKKISEIARSEKLSQTIAALSFKMMILEREIEGLRSGGVVKADNVANLINKRLKSGRKDNGKAR